MSNVRKVTVSELVDLVKPITKSTFIGLCYTVDESFSKTRNGSKLLQKTVCLTATLNHDYQTKVQKLTDNNEFVANPLKGKTKVSNTVLLSDKTGEAMLYATVLKSAKRETTYFHEGIEISREDAVKRELFAPSYFKPRPTKGRGTVASEDDFGLISPYFSNLNWVRVNGVEYQVVK
jgi:hypothetical protein